MIVNKNKRIYFIDFETKHFLLLTIFMSFVLIKISVAYISSFSLRKFQLSVQLFTFDQIKHIDISLSTECLN